MRWRFHSSDRIFGFKIRTSFLGINLRTSNFYLTVQIAPCEAFSVSQRISFRSGKAEEIGKKGRDHVTIFGWLRELGPRLMSLVSFIGLIFYIPSNSFLFFYFSLNSSIFLICPPTLLNNFLYVLLINSYNYFIKN